MDTYDVPGKELVMGNNETAAVRVLAKAGGSPELGVQSQSGQHREAWFPPGKKKTEEVFPFK